MATVTSQLKAIERRQSQSNQRIQFKSKSKY